MDGSATLPEPGDYVGTTSPKVPANALPVEGTWPTCMPDMAVTADPVPALSAR